MRLKPDWINQATSSPSLTSWDEDGDTTRPGGGTAAGERSDDGGHT